MNTFGIFLSLRVFHNSVYICFDFMDFSFYRFILLPDFFEIYLEHKSHGVEKEWYIKNCISHREYLSCCGKRNKIPKTDSRCRDDGKIKCIEVALPYRMSLLKCMYEYRPDEPTREKSDADDYEFSLVYMEHIREV